MKVGRKGRKEWRKERERERERQTDKQTEWDGAPYLAQHTIVHALKNDKIERKGESKTQTLELEYAGQAHELDELPLKAWVYSSLKMHK